MKKIYDVLKCILKINNEYFFLENKDFFENVVTELLKKILLIY